MTSGDLPEPLLTQIKTVGELCEKYNVPPKNLRRGEFTPDDLKQEYDKLNDLSESFDQTSSMKVDRLLGENVELDETREARYYLWDIAVAEKNEIVSEMYPHLGSLGFNDLKEVPTDADMNKNGFEFRNHYLIFCSRLADNYYLTGKLGNIRDDEISLSIPISYHRIGLPETTRETILAAHWRGPETIDELRSRTGTEFFIQKGTESYEHGLQDRTEFFFEKRDGRWHLQIEELLPRESIFHSLHTTFRGREIKYYTRYLHTILNEDCQDCFHLDGAIRGYGHLEDFIERHTERELQNPNPLKKMSSRDKLFKLDSPSGDIGDFGEIAGLFFKHNPHVQRFFEGDSEEAKELEEKRAQWYRSDFDGDQLKDELVL